MSNRDYPPIFQYIIISIISETKQRKMRRSSLTILMGSTGPMLLTYTAVSITVGLTGTTEDIELNLMLEVYSL